MLLVGILSFVLVLIDAISKQMIIHELSMFQVVEILPNFFNITYVKNIGGAFSILEGGRWFFIILGILSIIYIVRYILVDSKLTNYDLCCYSLILAGIVGNVVDRIVYNGVIDFLSFIIFGYNFPIFNLADSFIVIGVIMVIISLFFKGDLNENIFSRKRSK